MLLLQSLESFQITHFSSPTCSNDPVRKHRRSATDSCPHFDSSRRCSMSAPSCSFLHELQFTSENCVSCITAAHSCRGRLFHCIRDLTIQHPVLLLIRFPILLGQCLLLSQVLRNNLCQSSTDVTWDVIYGKASLTLLSFKAADTASLKLCDILIFFNTNVNIWP